MMEQQTKILSGFFERMLLASLCASAIFMSSCKEEYPFGASPEIAMIKYGPDTVRQFVDSIYFSISYNDGDGDLGENDTDADNLIVTDTRIGVKHTFRIKQLVPGGAQVPIKGTLNFSIPNTFLTGSSNQEELSYSIYVKDRAGHQSNVLTAGPIVVLQ
jgi:hypothetical protein